MATLEQLDAWGNLEALDTYGNLEALDALTLHEAAAAFTASVTASTPVAYAVFVFSASVTGAASV